MKLIKYFLASSLLIATFSQSQAVAEVANFDTCVNSLYALGGLSKDKARIACLPGIDQDTLNCQSRRFLVGFDEPARALKACQMYPQKKSIQEMNVYRGSYEVPPIERSKKTVCSITVNSSEEREAFRSELNPNEYSWVELLPQNSPGLETRFIPRDDLWIKKACREKIRCDVLVVSGHFASTFLGSSGFEVRLEDLTKFSCDQECKELFESVRQVYLFGCNTVSEKARDSRTIDGYRNILVVDGVSPHQAQRIAARRYTSYGQSLRSEIRKVFPQAEQIFGYAGPGPTGPNIKSTLQNYLKTAYSPTATPAMKAENFSRTLGRTGMLSFAGLAKDANSCRLPQSQIESPALRTVAGIQNYILNYARHLPVAALDIIFEAQQAQLIDESSKNLLVDQVFLTLRKASLKERRTALCPLLATDHARLLPADLKCTENLFWLNNGRPDVE